MWIELFIHSTSICCMTGTFPDTREDTKRENMIQLGRGSSRQSSEEDQLFGTREAWVWIPAADKLCNWGQVTQPLLSSVFSSVNPGITLLAMLWGSVKALEITGSPWYWALSKSSVNIPVCINRWMERSGEECFTLPGWTLNGRRSLYWLLTAPVGDRKLEARQRPHSCLWKIHLG